MKNNETKSLAKSARKAAASTIEASLIEALEKVAVKLKQNSKHFTKEIEKSSKRLAKKLSKEMKFEEAAKTEIITTAAVSKAATPEPASKGKVKAASPTGDVSPLDGKKPVKVPVKKPIVAS